MMKQQQIIYLDYNSTTPVDHRVLETMLPWFTEKFGNAASRSHAIGWEAEEAVTIAREQIAKLIGSVKEEIVFTSGATESINLAVKGVAEVYASKGNHIITCVTEHKAVLDTCAALEKKGVAVTYLPVNEKGMIDLNDLQKAITPSTILIALMYANNETGVIHPVKQIGAIAKEKKLLFFCDATQAVGKITVDVVMDDIDLMAFSSHKIYGPKGIGALYVRRKNPRVTIKSQIDGGGHERNMRSGTLNVPGIVGFGKAAKLAGLEMKKRQENLQLLRDKLESSLLQLGSVKINGNSGHRLPSTGNLCFGGINGTNLLAAISKKIAVSSGSACTSASTDPSHVLNAMGLSDEEARNSIRFSLGIMTTEQEIDLAIKEISEILRQLRAEENSISG
ncbi:MAG: IscS subfamily cysteine desulfurase [Chitinophagaceae bacterium]|nr:IscS subfamily cysteine desulfurase [Chitinophagaceae bacterium]